MIATQIEVRIFKKIAFANGTDQNWKGKWRKKQQMVQPNMGNKNSVCQLIKAKNE